jgi:hypothetical protein
VLSGAPSSRPAADAARGLLRSHLNARSYAPCVAAATALVVAQGFDCDDDLRAAAALAIAETFGLLDTGRARTGFAATPRGEACARARGPPRIACCDQ